jgi:hypothetical protein
LALELHDLPLARFARLLGPDVAVESGVLSGTALVRGKPASARLGVKGDLTLTDLQAGVSGSGKLARPIDLGIRLAGEVNLDTQAAVLRDSAVTLRVGKDSLALAVAGEVAREDAAARLQITCKQLVDVDRLQQLWQPAKADTTADRRTGRGAEPYVAPDLPAATVTLTLAGVRASDVKVADVNVRLQTAGAQVTVPTATFRFGDARASAVAELDLSAAEPAWKGKVQAEGVELAVLASAFAPDLPADVTGALKRCEASFSGSGSDPAKLRDTVRARASWDVERVGVSKARGSMLVVVQQLLMRHFKLTWDDLNFGAGAGEATVADGVLTLTRVTVASDELGFLATGTVRLADGVPDVKLVPAFKGGKARRLERGRIPLAKAADDWLAAPPLTLAGPVWEVSHLTKAVGLYTARLNPEVSAGMDVLDGLRDAVSGDKEEVDGKPSRGAGLGRAIQGGIRLWRSQEKRKDK